MTHARQRRQLLIAVLAVTLVLLGILARHAGTDRYDPDGQATARGERADVVARAKTLAAQAMSYDSGSAATDIAKVEQNMTPEMRVEYERTLPSSVDREKQASTGAKVVAKVVRAGVISLTDDEASVLVFVNQQASAKSTRKILESPTWEIIQLVRSGDEWLLSGMDAP
jgi:Mce-associated membrane protein